MIHQVKTQDALVAALAKAGPSDEIWLVGDAAFEVRGSSQVTAYGSSQVTAYESSQVTAYESSRVTAYESSRVTAMKFCAVTIPHGSDARVKGGVQIKVIPPKTAGEWCEFYGVPVKRGVAVLFKSVDDDYSTDRARRAGISYKPGSKPEAPGLGRRQGRVRRRSALLAPSRARPPIQPNRHPLRRLPGSPRGHGYPAQWCVPGQDQGASGRRSGLRDHDRRGTCRMTDAPEPPVACDSCGCTLIYVTRQGAWVHVAPPRTKHVASPRPRDFKRWRTWRDAQRAV